jgi:hypothetical protein
MAEKPPALPLILAPTLSAASIDALLSGVEIAPALQVADHVTGPLMAQALGLALFDDLSRRVPEAGHYWSEQRIDGRKLVLDHGALRTVGAGFGALPPGRQAFARLLEPLGYRQTAIYPLDRLGMTGFAYCHRDFAAELPQYFVSELHPERFSPEFQTAVARVTGTSRDPLTDRAQQRLSRLARFETVTIAEAAELLSDLVGCFARQHDIPFEEDYATLLAESAEMAWIATEGNVFNHATDRVNNVEAVAEQQRQKGRAIKDRIEVSTSGRVRQTALRATPVQRDFRRGDGGLSQRLVPGSFFEFISRDHYAEPESQISRLDLAFDTGNAQGIFKMTASGHK